MVLDGFVEGAHAVFEQFKKGLLSIDPVFFAENYLTLDGKPFRLNGNGYKPFADIYRYIGVNALSEDAKPVVMVKGRQVGATTMAATLELFFMASGLFGTHNRPPMRVMHCFPLLDLAYTYTKTKLNTMISTAVTDESVKVGGKYKTCVETKIDKSGSSSDSLQYKQFQNGNHVLIESTGLTADRLRGRQLCLETELPTPTGFVKLNNLKKGDRLFDENGKICKVTKLHPIQESPESYSVTFDDGTKIDACAEHLWITYTKRDRIKLSKGQKVEPSIKNTKELLETLKVSTSTENNHSIPTCLPAQYPQRDLLIDPYLLGLWLGDGNRQAQIETADPEILRYYEHRIIKSSINSPSNWGVSKSCSYWIKDLATNLKKIGLVYNPSPSKRGVEDGYYYKYIPDEYLYASVDQRLSLLQGLMDSDGCCYKDGRCEFVQVRERLAYDTYYLALSLGIKARIKKRKSFRYGIRYKDKYRITFSTDLPVFRLKRKLERIRPQNQIKVKQRFITSIERIGPKPMRCITVDSPSHLYLITRQYIPTHNTVDAIFFDECFPYDQCIETENGKNKIGKLYKMWANGEKLPLVKTFNEEKESFEYKKIIRAWKRKKRSLIQLTCGNRKIKCTPNHRFLTSDGWKEASDLKRGDLIKMAPGTKLRVRSLNDDQMQVSLGSFLGDGHLSSHKAGRYRLKIIHGLAQEDYCYWKAGLFNSKVKFIPENGYSKKLAVRFVSKTFGIHNEFPKNKSICPQWVLDKLDARGLAVWFMDDGSVRNNNACISTCSFDEDSQRRMVKKLQSMGIDCHYSFYKSNSKEKGYYSIYLNKSGYLKLCEIIAPFMCSNMQYKLHEQYKDIDKYKWNNNFNSYTFTAVDEIKQLEKKEIVYDIEVENNHNFIITSCRKSKNLGGLIAHNCQDIPGAAMANAIKTLSQAHYGPPGNGIQLYFGTPKQKGSDFWNIWQASSQQYYYLGCEACGDYFPLYTPESNDWEEIWIEDDIHPDYIDPKTGLKPHGFIVKCIHCEHEQDKRPAAERGKWVSIKDDSDDCKFIGYHINQLYMPNFSRQKIISEKPENNAINTERAYQNEVLGEFFAGDASPITPEQIKEFCADETRTFRRSISLNEGKRVYLGCDWGQKVDIDQLSVGEKAKRQRGQSYSSIVIISAEGPSLLSIEYAALLKRNDLEYKKGFIDDRMRQYSVHMGVGDIGYANDLTELLQRDYGERFLASRSVGNVKHHVKFIKDTFPQEIAFEKDYYISELYSKMKKGEIRFPYGSYEQIGWLVQHVSSMEIKPTIDRSGNVGIKYVKGPTPNDGFMALLNAFLAYKFDVTNGFNIKNPNNQGTPGQVRPALALVGHLPRMNPLKR